MKNQVFRVEINGFSNTLSTLEEVRTYVNGLKAQGYVKSGDKAVIWPGTAIKRAVETTHCFMNGFRSVVVS